MNDFPVNDALIDKGANKNTDNKFAQAGDAAARVTPFKEFNGNFLNVFDK